MRTVRVQVVRTTTDFTDRPVPFSPSPILLASTCFFALYLKFKLLNRLRCWLAALLVPVLLLVFGPSRSASKASHPEHVCRRALACNARSAFKASFCALLAIASAFLLLIHCWLACLL